MSTMRRKMTTSSSSSSKPTSSSSSSTFTARPFFMADSRCLANCQARKKEQHDETCCTETICRPQEKRLRTIKKEKPLTDFSIKNIIGDQQQQQQQQRNTHSTHSTSYRSHHQHYQLNMEQQQQQQPQQHPIKLEADELLMHPNQTSELLFGTCNNKNTCSELAETSGSCYSKHVHHYVDEEEEEEEEEEQASEDGECYIRDGDSDDDEDADVNVSDIIDHELNISNSDKQPNDTVQQQQSSEQVMTNDHTTRNGNATQTKQYKKYRPKNYQCPACKMAFSNNGQLKNHVRIHTGERPFRCNYNDCNKTFTRNEELTRHKLIHTGIRPHACTTCGKRFGRKDHLKKHVRTHERKKLRRKTTFEATSLASSLTTSDVGSIRPETYVTHCQDLLNTTMSTTTTTTTANTPILNVPTINTRDVTSLLNHHPPEPLLPTSLFNFATLGDQVADYWNKWYNLMGLYP